MNHDDPTAQQNQEQDETRSTSGTARQRRPRELPRRGYESQPRPMAPPPPSPLTTEQSQPKRVSRAAEQSARQTSPPPSSGASPARTRRRRPSKRDSGLYLPWWSLVILVVVAGVVSFGLLAAAMSFEGEPLGDQQPQVVIVTNANEATPFQAPNNNDQPLVPGSVSTTAPTTPTAIVTATEAPALDTDCPFGQIVEVTGTGAVGLSIRSEPRQGDNIQTVAYDLENFRIIGGPVTTTSTVDGSDIIWCEVEGIDFDTDDRRGWAARLYLQDIDSDE